MRKRLLNNNNIVKICCFWFFTMSLGYSQVNVSGRIINEFSQPVAGATIRLAVAKLSAITDSSGRYRIATTAVAFPGKSINPNTLARVGQSVKINITDPSDRVVFELYSFSGKKIVTLLDAVYQRGTHVLNPFKVEGIANVSMLLKAKIGSKSFSYRVMAAKGIITPAFLQTEGEMTSQYPLRKSQAAVDTLYISKPGYQSQHGTLSSVSIQLADIVLYYPLSNSVTSGWGGKATCNTLTITYGWFLCPTGRLSGYETLNDMDFLDCGTWTVNGDTLKVHYKQIPVALPSDYQYLDYKFIYYRGQLWWLASCSLALSRMAGGSTTQSDCENATCAGSSSTMKCGADADCGLCWYCENSQCKYGGMGPYGCYRGWQP